MRNISYCAVLFFVMLVVVVIGCAPTYVQPEETVEESQIGLSEEELAEIDWLVRMGVNALPEDERHLLLELHERFEDGGYGALSYDEIFTMRDLNEKAINLLPIDKELRFRWLVYRMKKQSQE